MFEALFKATFVTIFVVGIMSLINGEFWGWHVAAGWFIGMLIGALIFQRFRNNKSMPS